MFLDVSGTKQQEWQLFSILQIHATHAALIEISKSNLTFQYSYNQILLLQYISDIHCT